MADTPRILIVEDDLDLAEMLDAYFRVQHYEVASAAWGRDALRMAAEQSFQLVILDIRLPDISGYDVCRQLRTQRRTQDVPIIFLTEKRDRVDKLQGLELGVVDYITKPFDIQELILRVRNAINRAGQLADINPITELPQVSALDKRLKALVHGKQPWALLLVAPGGLGELREMYGFVAADEMLRAVTLMVRGAVREFGNEDDFIGHLGDEQFVVLTTADKVGTLRDRLETRIRQSLVNFYNFADAESQRANFLTVQTGVIDHDTEDYNDTDAIKSALSATIAPAPAGE